MELNSERNYNRLLGVMKARHSRIFDRICLSRIQIINVIVNEFEIEKRRKPATGENVFTEFVTVAKKSLVE